MNRKLIINIIGAVAIVIIAIAMMKKMAAGKTNPERVVTKNTKTVSVTSFNPQTVSFELPVYGQLQAKNKSEMYAEVNGIMLNNKNQFLEGVSFSKGQVLVQLDDTEAKANLMAQKSNYLNAISQVLPDLKIDFPSEYEGWKQYLENFNLHGKTSTPPSTTNKKAELYLTSQGVYSSYYNLKTAEARLDKYTIKAPYNGTVTESNIRPGTLVRPGMKMGEFIGLGKYELEIFVSSKYLPFIKKGQKVALTSPDIEGDWTGIIKRINAKIDQETQTVGIYIDVSGSLKDGMFMNGTLTGIHFEDAMRINRNLVFDNNHIYTVINDSTLEKSMVDVIAMVGQEAIIKDLQENTSIVATPISGGYPGMTVKVSKTK